MATEGRRWIDLHMHSTASDGVYPPAKLMQMARDRGLSAVALTDHDTVSGLREAAETAARIGLEFVPGIELAATRDRGALHILGYFVDPACPAFQTVLTKLVERRHDRNRAILSRLAEFGIDIDYERLRRDAGTEVVGRPHIAAAMIRCGAVAGLREAFGRFLGRGRPAFVARETLSAEDAIAVIREAGGVASLAHPSQLGCETRLELETILYRLKAAGLGAIEVLHPDHSTRISKEYGDLASRLGLATTGGSDFHALGPVIVRGVGFVKPRIPYSWLDLLREGLVR